MDVDKDFGIVTLVFVGYNLVEYILIKDVIIYIEVSVGIKDVIIYIEVSVIYGIVIVREIS